MRPNTIVPAFPTTRRCTCERNCSAPNSTSPRYRPRSEISSSIFFTYVSVPSPGAYLFNSSTNTTTASTPRSRRSRCSRSFDTTRAKTRSWPSGSTLATSTTYTARSSNRPHGRSFDGPSSVTRPLQRVEMFDRRLRTLRIVAMWCVRQVSPRPPPELQPVENRPEQPLQVGEGDHAMRPAEPVVELLVHNAIGEEIDEIGRAHV